MVQEDWSGKVFVGITEEGFYLTARINHNIVSGLLGITIFLTRNPQE